MPNEDLSCAELRGAIRRLKAQSNSLRARLGRATSRERESILIEIDDVQSELADDEAQAGIRGCNPPFSASLRWQSAPGFAIQRTTAPTTDHAAGPYHAGRVNDILALPAGSALAGSVLIGADTGGVWLHNPDGGTFPLSDGWDDPDVVCLAQGPHSDTQVYAGCSRTLYETIDSPGNPSVSFWRDLSPGVGMIFRIAVFSRARRIVLATSTGIHWSSIPPLGGNYSWQSASWPNLDPIFQTGSYSGLAAGPSDSVAAAAFGTDSNFSGIFFGTWIRSSRGFKLVMKRATITGARPSDLFRTSLASGASNRAIMYAVAARGPGDSWMFGVLKSTDGGRNWSRLSTRATSQSEPFPPGTALESGPPPAPDVAGGQGNYNNCIAVSPVNPEVVAIGWRNGPWVSTDGGSNWVMKHSADDNRHLHPDLHAVYFDPNDPLGEKLFVGSDGGVVVSPDRGETFDSSLNQRLLNLQFQSQPPRRFYGRFTASSATLGLIGGGLQDNGNVYCLDPAPWRQLDEGDGQLMMFFPMPFSIGNLLRYSNDGVGVKSAIFSGGEFDQLGVVPVTAGKPGVQYPNGLQGERLIVESVREPQFRQAPLDLMFAVAGLNQDVYGLFANSIGADMHWEFLGTVPIDAGDAILAVGSGDGKTVFAGSDEGRLFAMNPRDGSSVEQRVPQPIPTGSFFRIVVGTFNSYAILNTRLGGLILRANGNNWEAVSGGLPEEKFFSLEVPFGGTVFVATDRQVYVSANSGNNWFPASVGLPVRPHCSDLRYVQQKDGQTFLYLSTFGRSAWRIRM